MTNHAMKELLQSCVNDAALMHDSDYMKAIINSAVTMMEDQMWQNESLLARIEELVNANEQRLITMTNAEVDAVFDKAKQFLENNDA